LEQFPERLELWEKNEAGQEDWVQKSLGDNGRSTSDVWASILGPGVNMRANFWELILVGWDSLLYDGYGFMIMGILVHGSCYAGSYAAS